MYTIIWKRTEDAAKNRPPTTIQVERLDAVLEIIDALAGVEKISDRVIEAVPGSYKVYSNQLPRKLRPEVFISHDILIQIKAGG